MGIQNEVGCAGKQLRGIHLKALADIEDLSHFAVGWGQCNNNGCDGDNGNVELDALPPVSLDAGESFWIVNDAECAQKYFEFQYGDAGVEGMDGRLGNFFDPANIANYHSVGGTLYNANDFPEMGGAGRPCESIDGASCNYQQHGTNIGGDDGIELFY